MNQFTKGIKTILYGRSICSEATAGFHVKVTSKSTIKPSSPTLNPNLHHFKLSFIDQIILPALYETFVLFYPASKPTSSVLLMRQQMRHSLSVTLSHFYLLAGRIPSQEGNAFLRAAARFSSAGIISTIHCNDRGALFLEAEANQGMLQFLSSGYSSAQNRELVSRLAPPFPDIITQDDDVPLLSVQATAFKCGGLAVGVSLNHLVGDGHTFGMFMNKWASVTRGEDCSDAYYAHDMAASLFPPNEAVSKCFSTAVQKRARRATSSIMLQRFVFKADAISALKSELKSSQVPNPSRTVAISALIWKCAMNAATPVVRSSNAISVVSLRPRLKVPLPNYSMGNIFWPVSAGYTSKFHGSSTTVELKQLVYLLKQSIDVVDGEFVEKLTGEEGHKKIIEDSLMMKDGVEAVREYSFSSIVKIGVNESDFGWGKPIWAPFLGFTNVDVGDTVWLMEATTDGAVEAWVSLDEKEMAILQRDPDLLEYAIVNPPIISIPVQG